jgi:hypothetical protein
LARPGDWFALQDQVLPQPPIEVWGRAPEHELHLARLVEPYAKGPIGIDQSVADDRTGRRVPQLG